MTEVLIGGELHELPEVIAAHILLLESTIAKTHQMFRLETEFWGKKDQQRLKLIERIKKDISGIKVTKAAPTNAANNNLQSKLF